MKTTVVLFRKKWENCDTVHYNTENGEPKTLEDKNV